MVRIKIQAPGGAQATPGVVRSTPTAPRRGARSQGHRANPRTLSGCAPSLFAVDQGLRSLHSLNPWLISFHAFGVLYNSHVANSSQRLRDWLEILVQKGGSDLFLVVGQPAAIRVTGAVLRLEEPPLEGQEIQDAVLGSLPPHAAEHATWPAHLIALLRHTA